MADVARDGGADGRDGEHALALRRSVAPGAKLSPQWFLKQHPGLSASYCELLSLAALERYTRDTALPQRPRSLLLLIVTRSATYFLKVDWLSLQLPLTPSSSSSVTPHNLAFCP